MAMAFASQKGFIFAGVLPEWAHACKRLSSGRTPLDRIQIGLLWMEEHKPDPLFPFEREQRDSHHYIHASEHQQGRSQGRSS